jgi:outer membrane protein OmpA-like peptidoglycan-associated protein
MKKSLILLLIFLLGLWVRNGSSKDLEFPTTEKTIVEALSLKDGRIVHAGSEYVSQSGKVYKVIDGKRFRLRSIEVIADSDLAPRVGAMINFDFNQAFIRPEAYPLIDQFGKALNRSLPGAVILIEGHSDLVGSDSINDRLSLERAEAVKSYLIRRHSIKPDRLRTVGFGKRKPLVKTDKESEINRRVEFVRIGGF